VVRFDTVSYEFLYFFFIFKADSGVGTEGEKGLVGNESMRERRVRMA